MNRLHWAVLLAMLILSACKITQIIEVPVDTPGDTTTLPDTVSSDTTSASAVDSVSITPATYTIYIGQECPAPATLQLTVSVSPDTANQSVIWSVSDSSVASIDQDGKVTGLKAGVTLVTAHSTDDSTKFANATLTVSGQSCAPTTGVRTIAMSPQGTSGAVGTTLQTVVTRWVNGWVFITEGSPWWYSDNTSSILVDGNTGKITFLWVGSAQVCAQWDKTTTEPKVCWTFTTTDG